MGRRREIGRYRGRRTSTDILKAVVVVLGVLVLLAAAAIYLLRDRLLYAGDGDRSPLETESSAVQTDAGGVSSVEAEGLGLARPDLDRAGKK